MNALRTLNQRLKYQGGNQQQRFINDKLRTLKKALLYSYQAATAILADGRKFRCLINPDKNKPAYDNKIISIPYKDICLNSERRGRRFQEEEEIKIKPGDVFVWEETNTHWLIYLQALEEDAYFRSEIRRCDQEVKINDINYWVYLRGPVETAIEWAQKKGIEWNSLNYSMVMYITADKNTNAFFERFQTIKILDPRYNKEKTWQVVGVDPYYGDGILQVFLDEYFQNIFERQGKDNTSLIQQKNLTTPYIKGPTQVHQYSKAYYQICNVQGQGRWYLRWKGEEQDLKSSLKIIPLNISIGELGIFTLIYRVSGEEDIVLDITITAM